MVRCKYMNHSLATVNLGIFYLNTTMQSIVVRYSVITDYYIATSLLTYWLNLFVVSADTCPGTCSALTLMQHVQLRRNSPSAYHVA
jgi:hypothetical protein